MWGPHYFPDHCGDLEHLVLTPHQQSKIERRFGIIADIRRFDPLGICVGPTCTRQCRHALARTRPIPSDRHTPSDRQVPFARRGTSRLTRYTMSDRRGLTRQESYLHGRCSGEAPGEVAGWLLMAGGSCVVYYPRPPDHQQPSRKCAGHPPGHGHGRGRRVTVRHPLTLPKPRTASRQPRASVCSRGARGRGAGGAAGGGHADVRESGGIQGTDTEARE